MQCGVVQSVAVWCGVLQYSAVWCSVVQCGAVVHLKGAQRDIARALLQCVEMCCSVVHFVAACCSSPPERSSKGYSTRVVAALLLHTPKLSYVAKHCNTLQHTTRLVAAAL